MIKYEYSKIQIVETAQVLVEKGFLGSTGGNLSVRIPGQSAFAVTPTNYDYMKMTVNDVCVLDLKLNKIEGNLEPSVESGFHAGIYKTRNDVQAIIHTHQPIASALAVMNKPIPALFDEQVRYLGKSVDIIPYAPSGTKFLINMISKHVKDHNNAYILGNHGALCLGENLARAINNVEILEKCSIAYLLTLCTGEEGKRIPALVREIAFSKLRKDQKKIMQALTPISE